METKTKITDKKATLLQMLASSFLKIRFQGLLGLLIFLFALSTFGCMPFPGLDEGEEEGTTQVERTSLLCSLDKAVSAILDKNLLATPFPHAIMAMNSGASYRLYLSHQDRPLLDALGTLKEELRAQGWQVTKEQHYERATFLSLLDNDQENAKMARQIWLIPKDGGSFICEGMFSVDDPMGETLLRTCQSVKPCPPEKAESPNTSRETSQGSPHTP